MAKHRQTPLATSALLPCKIQIMTQSACKQAFCALWASLIIPSAHLLKQRMRKSRPSLERWGGMTGGLSVDAMWNSAVTCTHVIVCTLPMLTPQRSDMEVGLAGLHQARAEQRLTF